MTDIEELQHLLEVMKKFDLPVSPILEYAIKEKIDSLSDGEASFVTPDAVKDDAPIRMPKPKRLATEPKERKMKKATTIRVVRADGSIIVCEKAAHTMSKTIKEIGGKRIYELKLPKDGMHLVTIGGNPKYPNAQYDIGDGYFVNTHSNTADKKRQLEKIFSLLHLNWKVEIIESNETEP